MSPILQLCVCVCVSSCHGVSAVAARPIERCTAASPTVRPLTVSTPPMSPTTAAPSAGAVSLKSDADHMLQVPCAAEDSAHLESIHSASLGLHLFCPSKSIRNTL